MASLLRGAAFITGAGSGIGQYTAYAFAKYGVRQLALCDIRSDSLEQTRAELQARHPGIEILNIEMDASKEDSIDSAVEQTVQKFSRLDIAVNNAGIGHQDPTDQLPLDTWRKVMSVNLDGVFLCQRAQIRQMLKQEPLDPLPRGNRGVIVNVSSMLGLVASSPGTPAVAYTASKHGVMGLTKTDAVMYAPRGIRINAMCPGYVATPLLKASVASGGMSAEVAKVPQQRLGEMEEIADSITFLASPMSSFMAGHGLAVDGGYTCQ
ncbi:hypothetical protein B0A55_09407 [Friedmanniomyces simplex]|uniref:3-oxoacyl-[acyl-carrier-protein] reductase FabG n=1 Tax=Friedmanniomyces simplex TaxID=329884 RepID=A0A4U0WMF5_9PEZI|nr:hypothetical protein B0A55_09407 [Friedmanniomyces simplex]